MIKLIPLLLGLAVAACAAPTPEMAAHPNAAGATTYSMSKGALVGCTTTGFDTVCKSN